jgi:hypothetical protein
MAGDANVGVGALDKLIVAMLRLDIQYGPFREVAQENAFRAF